MELLQVHEEDQCLLVVKETNFPEKEFLGLWNLVPLWNIYENGKMKWKYVGGRFQRIFLLKLMMISHKTHQDTGKITDLS
jgi:hypothetical protein